MGEKVQGEVQAKIEALLFVSPAPLTLKRMCEIISGVEKDEVREILDKLKKETSRPDRGVELVETAGGWRLQTKAKFRQEVQRLRQRAPQRLSRAALETLAIIAYKQPVTRAEIEQARGVDSSGTIRYLLDKRLIRIIGRKDVPGRPLLYGTTKFFLEVFQLKDLSALPSHRELKAPGQGQQIPLFEPYEP